MQKACMPDGVGGAIVVTFWLNTLTKLTRWQQDRAVLYIVDNLLKAAFRNPQAQQVASQFFYTHCKVSGVSYLLVSHRALKYHQFHKC